MTLYQNLVDAQTKTPEGMQALNECSWCSSITFAVKSTLFKGGIKTEYKQLHNCKDFFGAFLSINCFYKPKLCNKFGGSDSMKCQSHHPRKALPL